MIKKYFALSLVTASMIVAGCSSDNEDETPAFVATPGVGGTAFDSIANSTDHTTLLAAIQAAGLDDALDNPASTFTIFAPTDAAFTALDNDGDDATPTTADLLADVPALTRILQYHVVSGDVSAEAVGALIQAATAEAPATASTLLVDGNVTQTLTFTTSATAATGVAVNEVDIDTADVVPTEGTAVGRVHVIGSILLPPAAPDTGGTTGGDTGGTTGGDTGGTTGGDTGGTTGGDTGGTTGGGDPVGAVDTALSTAGGYSIFRTGVNTHFSGNLDSAAWTVFVPSDSILSGAGVSSLTASQVQDHIVSSSAVAPTALAGLTSITASSGLVYTVATTGGVTTVNGSAVELITTGAGGAQIYSIAGVLAAP
jgi:transforming growth factor-beta-induced protein